MKDTKDEQRSPMSPPSPSPESLLQGIGLLEDLPLYLYARDTEGVYTAASGMFCEVVGRSRDEVIGSTNFELFPKELAEEYDSKDARVEESGGILGLEEREFEQNGSPLVLQFNKLPLRDESGKHVGVLGLGFDITKRKEAEEAMREGEERYEALAASPFEALVIHEGGRVLEANKAFYELGGHSETEVLGADMALPAPFGPSSPMISPYWAWKERSRRDLSCPYDF